jgi:hypothetical protein
VVKASCIPHRCPFFTVYRVDGWIYISCALAIDSRFSLYMPHEVSEIVDFTSELLMIFNQTEKDICIISAIFFVELQILASSL